MNGRRLLVAVAMCLIVAGSLAGIVVAMRQVAFPIRPHLGPIALAPETAAADMLNNRGTIRDFRVQSKRPWPGGVLVVHHYTVGMPGEPPRLEFGYALVELRRGGWSVFEAELQGIAPPPARVTYASAEVGSNLLVYGQILDQRIAAVEMTTDTGQIVRGAVDNGGFGLVAPHAQALSELRILDQRGQIMERYDMPSITAPVP